MDEQDGAVMVGHSDEGGVRTQESATREGATPATSDKKMPDKAAGCMGYTDGLNSGTGDTGFISRVSPVQVRPLLLAVQQSPLATVTREPAEEYHNSPGISCSMLKGYAESPLGFYLRFVAKTAPPKSSPALRTGTLLHLRHELLSDEAWQQAIAIAPDSVTTAAGQLGKTAKGWLADLPPTVIGVTQEEVDLVDAIWAGVLRNEAAREIIEQRVDAEFNVRWHWNGMLMRCRCDGATPDSWYDLKTTSDTNILRQFGGSVRKWGYDLQSAVYSEAASAAGWPDHRLTFIVVGTAWPHLCHVVRLPPSVIERARYRAMRYLREIQDRLEWDDWLPDDYGKVTDLDMGNNWRD